MFNDTGVTPSAESLAEQEVVGFAANADAEATARMIAAKYKTN